MITPYQSMMLSSAIRTGSKCSQRVLEMRTWMRSKASFLHSRVNRRHASICQTRSWTFTLELAMWSKLKSTIILKSTAWTLIRFRYAIKFYLQTLMKLTPSLPEKNVFKVYYRRSWSVLERLRQHKSGWCWRCTWAISQGEKACEEASAFSHGE